MKNELLLIPDKKDIERDAIANIWEQRGGKVLRIGKFWIKPETNNKRVSIYGNDTFCLVLAQILGIKLLMPKDELIATADKSFLKRKITIETIKEINTIDFPKFIKPVTPKLFNASVFNSVNDLKIISKGIKENEKIICSEIIKVEKEVRSFILDNTIKDLAYYEGDGKLNEPKLFIDSFLKNNTLPLPKTYVLDIGFNHIHGWFIIEFNSSWGAGLNHCVPEKVIECIREATIN